MAEKIILTHEDVWREASALARRIKTDAKQNNHAVMLYGVPRGGIPVAYLLLRLIPTAQIVDTPGASNFIVDDLIDSGKTELSYAKYGAVGCTFDALIDKRKDKSYKGKWIVFPWEVGQKDESATDNIVRLLQYIGEDPNREGLKETPERVLKAWKHWTSGYGMNPADVMKNFKDGSENYDEMIIESPIHFFSMCEHHMAPFFGTATIGYIPGDKGVCGLSKIPRVFDIFARRLQVQERLTVQTADALVSLLEPKGVGVVVTARHTCMESRGVMKQGTFTTTSALRGVFKDKPEVRAEFLKLATP